MRKITTLALALVLLGLFMPWAGGAMNVFVEDANGGMMPVWCPTPEIMLSLAGDPVHSLLTSHTNYWGLADILPMPVVFNGEIVIGEMMSIGDLAIFAGCVAMSIGASILAVAAIARIASLYLPQRRPF